MKNVFRTLSVCVITALLMVSVPVFADNYTSSLKTNVNDSMITAKVKSQLVANDVTKATTINVKTNHGIVTLTGTVDSEIEAATAIQIAASTADVKQVNTQNFYYKTESGQQQQNKQFIQDSYITAKVKGLLIREKLINNIEFPAMTINVETKNSIVYLNGTVEHEKQLKKAIELSKSIKGVKKVISKLNVVSG